MRYDLGLIVQLCNELGLTAVPGDSSVQIQIGRDDVLIFENAERDEDCLMGFEGSPWHVHDDIAFSDGSRHVEMNYLDVVAGLADGRLLVCETRRDDGLVSKELVHRDFNDEFRWVSEGNEIRVRRPRRTARRTAPSDPENASG